jgi:hypothetical protein
MSWTITPQTKVPVDPFRSQVSLLLHGNQSGGQFIDSSPTPKSITKVGDVAPGSPGGGTPVYPSSNSAFGNAIAFDGDGDSLFVAAGNSQFNLSSGNWTLECWVYFNTFSVNSDPHVFQISADSSNRYVLFRNSSNGKLSFTTVNNNIYVFTNSTTTPVVNTWYHVAVSKTGAGSALFVNGTQEAINVETISSGTLVEIGYTSSAAINQYRLNGYIDDLRITKGVARYTSNFSVPAAPFPDI